MRRLLVATVLLYTVMSDDSLTQNRQEAASRVHEEEHWSKRGKRVPRDTFSSEFDDSANYAPEKFPRISGSRVLVKPLKLPPVTMIRPLDTGSKFSRNDQSDGTAQTNLECKVVNPTVLVSIDFAELLDEQERVVSDCISKKCRRRTQGWELQKPFYVEEPRWIEIESDYADNLSHHLEPNDPFVLTRGKKIHRLKDSVDTEEKKLADYEELINTRSNSRKLTMSRLLRKKRSLESEKSEDKKSGKEEYDTKKKEYERRGVETRGGNIFLRDLQTTNHYEDPFIASRGKKMYTQSDEREKESPEEYFFNKKRIMDITLKNLMRGRRELKSFNNKESIKQNDAINARKRTENSDGTSINNPINLTAMKGEPTEYSQGNVANLNLPYISTQQRNLSKTGQDFNNTSEEEESISLFNSRDKRSSYGELNSVADPIIEKNGSEENIDGYSALFKDVVSESNYLDRRDKHSDIMDILEEPFFISRGKKTIGNEFNGSSTMIRKQDESEYNALLNRLAIRNFLNRLSEMSLCTTPECINDYKKIAKRKSQRDRRGALDELLAKYDPYYVARGKRMPFGIKNLDLKLNGNVAPIGMH